MRSSWGSRRPRGCRSERLGCRLCGHLAYLRLAAAEALPAELDHAAKHQLGLVEIAGKVEAVDQPTWIAAGGVVR